MWTVMQTQEWTEGGAESRNEINKNEWMKTKPQ